MPIDLDKMLFKLKLKQDGELSVVKLLVDKDSVISTTMMLVILELRPVLTLPTPPPWSYSSGKFWSNCDRCREGASGLATTTHTGWH